MRKIGLSAEFQTERLSFEDLFWVKAGDLYYKGFISN